MYYIMISSSHVSEGRVHIPAGVRADVCLKDTDNTSHFVLESRKSGKGLREQGNKNRK